MIAEALLLGTNIEKSFGATRALKGVTIALRPGEVHAIVGENGAGKSTLSKILSGVAEPDGGELSYRGERLRPWNPIVAKRLGVRCVHQELELAPTLTVAENIFLGDLPTRRGLVDHPEMERRAREVLKSLGADVDPRTVTGTLNVSNRQIVEIARALVRSATVLLLDEPTAALPPVEVRKLLDLMRRLREQGVAVVYISHRLDEVMEIADRISVLRDGRKVAELAAIETNRRELIAHILGEELAGSEFDKAEDVGSPLISVDCLRNGDDLHDVKFQVAKNQVVGFFGLLGAGQGSIAKSLFGLDKRAKAAECVIGGTRVLPADPKDAIRRNIGYVPADRRFEGLTLNLSILENLLLPSLERVSRWGFVQKRVARREGEAIASRFAVRMRDIDQPVRELSGGNQQKVVLAKWIMAGARILLLEEPTRGVDVGAKVEIYKNIRDVTRQGDRCCLLFSSDAEEIAIVCDSAYVLQRGRIVARLHGRNLTANRLVKEALG